MHILATLATFFLGVCALSLVMIRNRIVETNDGLAAINYQLKKAADSVPEVLDVRVINPVKIADVPLPVMPVLDDALHEAKPRKGKGK